MIENLMYAALGAVVVALLGLLLIPAIHNRAERLARRRTEALFPLSIAELTAEKDHLRAEFAVQQRVIERKAEEALAFRHGAMEDLGRCALRIEALTTSLAERDEHNSTLQRDLADAKAQLGGTATELAAAKTALSTTRETLAAVENAHRRTIEELARTRADLERIETELGVTRGELGLALDKITARETANADLQARQRETLSELDAKRIIISDLETRVATQIARGDEFERTLSDRRGELSEERQRLADLARNLLAEQERGLVLDQRIRELEHERLRRVTDAEALASRLQALTAQGGTLNASLEERAAVSVALERELADARRQIGLMQEKGRDGPASDLRALAERNEILRAEKVAVEGALAEARDERARLAQEVKAMRRNGSAPSDEIRVENAELRRQIDKLADEIMQAAAKSSAPAKTGRRSAAG